MKGVVLKFYEKGYASIANRTYLSYGRNLKFKRLAKPKGCGIRRKGYAGPKRVSICYNYINLNILILII